MVRICKSLVAPEQGYRHREHRSRRGLQSKNHPMAKKRRNSYKRSLEAIRHQEDEYEQNMRLRREGWLEEGFL